MSQVNAYLTDGILDFQPDCTHAMKVPLPVLQERYHDVDGLPP